VLSERVAVAVVDMIQITVALEVRVAAVVVLMDNPRMVLRVQLTQAVAVVAVVTKAAVQAL
tara:strand:- start:375 stop:557 length:183 start_codon:yes stop_codon:yes gene_type:complete